MMIRLGLLVSTLAFGLTALPSDCYGFDPVGQKKSADCAVKRTAPCTAALAILPSDVAVPAADAAAPLPLPRPPNLGRPTCELPNRVSVTPEVCR
jgi:hypothetical protein